MAQKIFSFTMPATTNYYSLWTQLQGITGFFAPNELVPDRVSSLIIDQASGNLNIADSNYANSPGIVIGSSSPPFNRSAERNRIDLKNIYLKGSGVAVSGFISWQ